MPKLLVVDDEERIRDIIREYAEFNDFQVTEAADGMEAVECVKKNDFDIIVMDIMMPKLDGYSACKEIKKIKDIPVIMLTAKSSEIDKVSGLELGADDYITKPFGVMEMLSRIKAVLRRTARQEDDSEVLTIREVSLDVSKRIVTVNGQEVALTYREFELLMYLMRHVSIAVSRDKLMERVWGYEFAGETRTVDMHIKTIRQKLEAAGCTDIIKTVRGVGYKV